PASSAPRSTATAPSRARTSSSCARSRRRACACSPPAASAPRTTSPRSPAPAPRAPSSAARSSRGHEPEVGLERPEVEAVRRPAALVEEVDAEDRVGLVDVAVPERPRQFLQPAPRHDRERLPVVADHVDGVAAPRAGPGGPVEPAGPVPGPLPLGRERELEADVEAAEEERGRADEPVVRDRHARERADPVAADAAPAPVLEHVELDRALLAGERVDLLDAVERRDHRALADLNRLAPHRRRPGL